MLQLYLFWVVMAMYVMDRQFNAPREDLKIRRSNWWRGLFDCFVVGFQIL